MKLFSNKISENTVGLSPIKHFRDLRKSARKIKKNYHNFFSNVSNISLSNDEC